MYQPQLSLQHGDQSSFRTDQRAGKVESAPSIWKKLVEVVTRDTAGNIWILSLDQSGKSLLDGGDAAKDLTNAPGFFRSFRKFLASHPSRAHSQPVVGKHLQLFHVVNSLARHLRVGAARVVTDHSSQRAPRMG